MEWFLSRNGTVLCPLLSPRFIRLGVKTIVLNTYPLMVIGTVWSIPALTWTSLIGQCHGNHHVTCGKWTFFTQTNLKVVASRKFTTRKRHFFLYLWRGVKSQGKKELSLWNALEGCRVESFFVAATKLGSFQQKFVRSWLQVCKPTFLLTFVLDLPTQDGESSLSHFPVFRHVFLKLFLANL